MLNDKVDCTQCANYTGFACKEYGTSAASAQRDCELEGFQYFKNVDEENVCNSEK